MVTCSFRTIPKFSKYDEKSDLQKLPSTFPYNYYDNLYFVLYILMYQLKTDTYRQTAPLLNVPWIQYWGSSFYLLLLKEADIYHKESP